MADSEKVLFTLEAQDNASPKIQDVINKLQQLSSAGGSGGGGGFFNNMSASIDKTLDGMERGLRSFTEFTNRWTSATAGIDRTITNVLRNAGEAVYDFTSESIKNYMEFSQQHAQTMGVMANNAAYKNNQQAFFDDSEQLKNQAMNLGMFGPTGQGSLSTVTEVSDMQTQLLKAGLDPSYLLSTSVTSDVLKFAQANQLKTSDAVDFAVALGNQFNVPKEDWGNMLDKVAHAADLSTIDVSNIVHSMKYAGGITSGLGRDLEETLGIIAVEGNFGLKGSQAGSSIQALMTRLLTGDTTVITNAQKEVAPPKALEAFYEFEKKVKPDGNLLPMTEVQDTLEETMSTLNDEEQAWFAKKLFGLYQMKGAYALINGDMTLDEVIEEIRNQSDGTNDNKLTQLLNSSWGKYTSLENMWDAIQTDFGERLSPFTNAILDELFNFLSNNGKYDISFDNLRDGLQKASDKIAERYGQALGNAVNNIGNIAIDLTEIGATIGPEFAKGLATVVGNIFAKDANGNAPGLFDIITRLFGAPFGEDWGDMIQNMRDAADGLPDNLKELANGVISAADSFAKLYVIDNVVGLLGDLSNALLGVVIIAQGIKGLIDLFGKFRGGGTTPGGGGGNTIPSMNVTTEVMYVNAGTVIINGGPGGTPGTGGMPMPVPMNGGMPGTGTGTGGGTPLQEDDEDEEVNTESHPNIIPLPVPYREPSEEPGEQPAADYEPGTNVIPFPSFRPQEEREVAITPTPEYSFYNDFLTRQQQMRDFGFSWGLTPPTQQNNVELPEPAPTPAKEIPSYSPMNSEELLQNLPEGYSMDYGMPPDEVLAANGGKIPHGNWLESPEVGIAALSTLILGRFAIGEIGAAVPFLAGTGAGLGTFFGGALPVGAEKLDEGYTKNVDLGDQGKYIAQYDGEGNLISLKVDTSEVDAAKQKLTELSTSDVSVSINADGNIDILDEAGEKTAELDGKAASMSLNADGNIDIFDEAGNKIAEVDGKTGEVTITATDDVTDKADSARDAVNSIPSSKNTTLGATDGITGKASGAKSSIWQIPGSKFTVLNATDGTSSKANTAKGSVNGVPNSKHTSLTASDGTSAPSNNAKNAVNRVPNSKHTSLSASDGVSGVAATVKSALAGIPRSITVAINAVSSGIGSVVNKVKNLFNRETGESNASENQPVIINDQDIADPTEIVEHNGVKYWFTMPDGSPVRNLPLKLSAGDRIYTASQSRDQLKKMGIKHYEDGMDNNVDDGIVDMSGYVPDMRNVVMSTYNGSNRSFGGMQLFNLSGSSPVNVEAPNVMVTVHVDNDGNVEKEVSILDPTQTDRLDKWYSRQSARYGSSTR